MKVSYEKKMITQHVYSIMHDLIVWYEYEFALEKAN